MAAVAAGRRILAGPLALTELPPGPLALVDSDGRLVALAELDAGGGWVQPRKVLVPQ